MVARKPWIVPLSISGAATAIALLFSLVVYPAIQVPLAANIDPDRLGELATNIAQGKGYVYSEPAGPIPAFDRGPVYPFMVALIFRITGGTSYVAVQVLQSVLHGLTCWVAFLLASRLYSRRTALTAQALCALHPMLVWYAARIWIETTHTLLVTAAALSMVLLFERTSLLRGGAAGLMLGIASLTKSLLLPFSLIVGTVLLLQKGKESRTAVMAMVLVSLAVVSPWTARNYIESGAFVPVHTSLGLNMVQGDAIGEHWAETPFSTLAMWGKGKERMDSILSGSGASPVSPEGDRLLVEASVKYNLSHPGVALRRVLINGFTFWWLGESPLKSIFLAVIELPLAACVVLGSLRLRRKSFMAPPLIFLAGYYSVVHAFIVGWARYSSPLVPVAIVLAAAVMEVWRGEAPAG